jgi:hypothetical protein
MWTAHARFILGCALAEQGNLQAGIDAMDAADKLWASTGSILTRSFYLAMRARGYARLQDAGRARELIDEAWSIVSLHGERYFEPEVLRIKGELLLGWGLTPDQSAMAEARRLFERSVSAARMRKLKALELRSMTSLVQVLRHQDDAETLWRKERELDALLDEAMEGQQTRDVLLARRCLAAPQDRLDLL